MDLRLKVIIAVASIMVVAAFGALAYSALTSPTVDVTGLQTLSTNPGLMTNASTSERYVHVSQNLTALLSLSPQWPVLVKSISITTPGFRIMSMNASLPFLVDQTVTVSVVLSSNQSYSGAVLFIINSLNASSLAEKILVPDVVADTSSKTVTLVSVFNAGDVPLTNSIAYLVRSDGLVVNSTALATAGLLPGKISYFNIDMSYANATVVEIYRIRVVTTMGADATSRVFALTCNC